MIAPPPAPKPDWIACSVFAVRLSWRSIKWAPGYKICTKRFWDEGGIGIKAAWRPFTCSDLVVAECHFRSNVSVDESGEYHAWPELLKCIELVHVVLHSVVCHSIWSQLPFSFVQLDSQLLSDQIDSLRFTFSIPCFLCSLVAYLG